MNDKPISILILPYFNVNREVLKKTLVILEQYVSQFILVKDERNPFDVKYFLNQIKCEIPIDWLSYYSIDVCHRWFLGFEYAKHKFNFAKAFIFPCDLNLSTLSKIKPLIPEFIESQAELTLGDYKSTDPIKTLINQNYILPVINILFKRTITKRFEVLKSPRTEFLILQRNFYEQFLQHRYWWPFEVTPSLILFALLNKNQINIKDLGKVTDDNYSRRRRGAFYQLFRSTFVLKAEALRYDKTITTKQWTQLNLKIINLQNLILDKIDNLSSKNI